MTEPPSVLGPQKAGRDGRRWLRAAAGHVGALLPRREDYTGLRRTWRGDVLAGLTVGVVALPLALAFGITTGLGAEAGLITAIVAGLVAAVFGGSNVQVSGPTGAMTVVLVPIVTAYGSGAVLVVGILAGVLILAAAFGHLGRYLAYIPWPVVEGFTLGIAILIFLQQVPTALGVPKPEGDNTAVVAVKAVIDAFGTANLAAMGLVGLVAIVMVATPHVRRSLPASLVAVAAATLVAELGSLDVARIGALPSSLPMPVAARRVRWSTRRPDLRRVCGCRCSPPSRASSRPGSPTAWPTMVAMTLIGSCSGKVWPTSCHRCSEVCRRRVRSRAPPSTCAPERAPVLLPLSTR